MQNPVKILLVASFSLFIFSCNSSKKDEQKKETIADTLTTDIPIHGDTEGTRLAPPNSILPGKKCFSNEGLKYNMRIEINYDSPTEVIGTVTSTDAGTGTSTSAKFSGVIEGDKLTVTFQDKKPVIGDASEWTNKPWTITDKKISILFNAKNYDTNKWKETNYDFELSDCK